MGCVLLLAAAVAVTGVTPVEAAPLTGGFSKVGSFRPVDGVTGLTTTLGAATGLDFLPQVHAPGFESPGIPGEILVNNASGSFAGIAGFLGATGNINDFSFAGAGSANFPVLPISPLEFNLPGGVTFNLTSIVISLQNNAAIVLEGLGFFTATGFDMTPGTFVFTGNAAAGTFSFSASQDTIPEPGTLLLFGAGLFGFSAYAQRRRKRAAANVK
ncbi:MAG TPA: PEP-CTERM sorting domain-containing protein [Vicinamibacterales bacterium]|nr:PEP-CTERM sorting domain-containing protein [Vicinamibacterales bacterium]